MSPTIDHRARLLRAGHWNEIYGTRSHDDLGWYESEPATLADVAAHLPARAGVIDIGAGSGRMVDSLLDRGVTDITLLDLSTSALDAVAARLGPRGDGVEMIAVDVTEFVPERTWSLWHDRATFHFLTDPDDRAAYVQALERSLEPGGHAVIATFSPDGPDRCAGLPVERYDATTLATQFSDVLQCEGCRTHTGEGPKTDSRPYVICRFHKTTGPESGPDEES